MTFFAKLAGPVAGNHARVCYIIPYILKVADIRTLHLIESGVRTRGDRPAPEAINTCSRWVAVERKSSTHSSCFAYTIEQVYVSLYSFMLTEEPRWPMSTANLMMKGILPPPTRSTPAPTLTPTQAHPATRAMCGLPEGLLRVESRWPSLGAVDRLRFLLPARPTMHDPIS